MKFKILIKNIFCGHFEFNHYFMFFCKLQKTVDLIIQRLWFDTANQFKVQLTGSLFICRLFILFNFIKTYSFGYAKSHNTPWIKFKFLILALRNQNSGGYPMPPNQPTYYPQPPPMGAYGPPPPQPGYFQYQSSAPPPPGYTVSI